MKDKELHAQRESLAFIDARLADLLQRVDNGESGALWAEVKAACTRLEHAMENHNPYQIETAFKDLRDKINLGTTDYAIWREIMSLIDQRCKTSASELRRLVVGGHMIPAEQAIVLFTAIGDVVRRNVTDMETLNRITQELAFLMEHPGNEYNAYSGEK